MTYRPGFRTAVSMILLLAASAACTPGVSVAQEASADASTASEPDAKVYLPEGFPENFRFPAGSVLSSASGGMPPEYSSRSYVVEAKTGLTKAEVADFYRTMLEKKFENVRSEEGYATVFWFDAPGLDEGSVMIVDGYDDDGTCIVTVSMIMDPEPE